MNLTLNALKKLQQNGAFSDSVSKTDAGNERAPDTEPTTEDAHPPSSVESLQHQEEQFADSAGQDAEHTVESEAQDAAVEALEPSEPAISQESGCPGPDEDSFQSTDQTGSKSGKDDESSKGKEGIIRLADQPHELGAPAPGEPATNVDLGTILPEIQLVLGPDEGLSVDDEEIVNDAILDEAWDELATLAAAKSLQAELRDVVSSDDDELTADPPMNLLDEGQEDSVGVNRAELQMPNDQPTTSVSGEVTKSHDLMGHRFTPPDSLEERDSSTADHRDDEAPPFHDVPPAMEVENSIDEEGFSPVISSVDDLLDDISDFNDQSQIHPNVGAVPDSVEVDPDSSESALDELAVDLSGAAAQGPTAPIESSADERPCDPPDSDDRSTPTDLEDASESCDEDGATTPLETNESNDTVSLQGELIPVVQFGVEQKSLGRSNKFGDFNLTQSDIADSRRDADEPEFEDRLVERFTRICCQTAVDHALDRIELHCQQKQPQVLLLTSVETTPETADAIGLLAMGLCRRGKKVLLLDADMSEQSLTRAFKALGQPGLCDVLDQTADALAVVRPTSREGIHLVPCGDDVTGISRDPALVPEGQLVSALRSWQEEFSCILIDAGACESALLKALGENSQTAALLVPYAHADSQRVQSAARRLSEAAADVAGCLLTDFPATSP